MFENYLLIVVSQMLEILVEKKQRLNGDIVVFPLNFHKLVYYYQVKQVKKEIQYQTLLCGSGTTGVACKQLKRNFIGIELNEDYYNISKDRIDKTVELKKQSKLF